MEEDSNQPAFPVPCTVHRSLYSKQGCYMRGILKEGSSMKFFSYTSQQEADRKGFRKRWWKDSFGKQLGTVSQTDGKGKEVCI